MRLDLDFLKSFKINDYRKQSTVVDNIKNALHRSKKSNLLKKY